MGPVHFRFDGHGPFSARVVARLGLDPPRGPGARARAGGPSSQADRILAGARPRHRRDRGGPAVRRLALADQRPWVRTDRALRQFQRLVAGARLHRAGRLVLRQAEALVLPPRGNARVDLRRDEPARPGQPPGEPVSGQARRPDGSPGRVAFLVAAAHRLVANAGLRARELRPDLPEREGAPAAWLRRPRGCASRCSTS